MLLTHPTCTRFERSFPFPFSLNPPSYPPRPSLWKAQGPRPEDIDPSSDLPPLHSQLVLTSCPWPSFFRPTSTSSFRWTRSLFLCQLACDMTMDTKATPQVIKAVPHPVGLFLASSWSLALLALSMMDSVGRRVPSCITDVGYEPTFSNCVNSRPAGSPSHPPLAFPPFPPTWPCDSLSDRFNAPVFFLMPNRSLGPLLGTGAAEAAWHTIRLERSLLLLAHVVAAHVVSSPPSSPPFPCSISLPLCLAVSFVVSSAVLCDRASSSLLVKEVPSPNLNIDDALPSLGGMPSRFPSLPSLCACYDVSRR
jgi:hypothetical protein